jgi:hypothetical protein
MATITAATKKSLRPTSSENVSIEPTRISAISAVTVVATASVNRAVRKDHARISPGSAATCIRRWRRSVYHVTPT